MGGGGDRAEALLRLRLWEQDELWLQIWRAFLRQLDGQDPLKWGAMFCRRQFCSRQKGSDAVGKTKRGKGTKWMVAVDGQGIALGSNMHSASPAEATLVEGTLATISVPRQHGGRPRQKPQRVIAERANDSDSLRRRLQARGIELVCSHRKSRRKPPTQDGRALRRYRKCWKVERTFAWLGNFRRLVVRYDRHSLVYQAFFRIACLLITLRHL